jgi:hypothetical protein
LSSRFGLYTDKRERKLFLIDKGIQKGAVAKSYMTNGLLMTKIFAHFPYIRKPLLIQYMTLQPLQSEFHYI